MKDLTSFPLKEIEDTFNKEMWREKTGIRMKYKGIDTNRAVFEIYPLSSLGIVISDFQITEVMEYAIKELFKSYDLDIDLWNYATNKIILYIRGKI